MAGSDLTISDVQTALKGWILVAGLSSSGWTAQLHRPVCCAEHIMSYLAQNASLTEAAAKVISLRDGAES